MNTDQEHFEITLIKNKSAIASITVRETDLVEQLKALFGLNKNNNEQN